MPVTKAWGRRRQRMHDQIEDLASDRRWYRTKLLEVLRLITDQDRPRLVDFLSDHKYLLED